MEPSVPPPKDLSISTTSFEAGNGATLTLRDLHDLHLKLEELIAEGQHPLVALCLRERFLRAVLPLGASAWAGYGFPTALNLGHRTSATVLQSCDPFLLSGLDETIARCEGLPLPPWAEEEEWVAAISTARRVIREAVGRVDERLRTETAHVRGAYGSAWVDPLERVDKEQEPASVFVPVVVGPRSRAEIHPYFQSVQVGILLRLFITAQLVVRSRGQSDLTVAGRLAPDTRQAWEATIRTIGHERLTRSTSIGREWFHASWVDAGAQIEGRSATLGFCLAALAARTRLSAGIAEHELAQDLALTGDLDGLEIRPVNAKTLPLKVRACFFGPIQRLVVPWEQREAAIQEARILGQAYPSRQILITGARRVSELIQDPTVWQTRLRTPGRVARSLLRRVATSRWATALLLAIAVSLAGIGAREWWVSRPLAEQVSVDGGNLIIRNHYARVCGQVANAGVSEAAMKTVSALPTEEILGVWDLTGRGEKEVLAIRQRGDTPENLLWVGDARGRTIWRCGSGALLTADALDLPPLRWFFFCPLEPDPTGEMPILTVRKGVQSSLCLVELFRSLPPRREGILRTFGHVEVAFRGDVDRDERDELFLGGTDNKSGCAILALIAPDRMAMPSPFDSLDAVPLLTEPAALKLGVRTAIRLPRDAFIPFGRPACTKGLIRGSVIEATTVTALDGDSNIRSVLFSLDLSNPDHPAVLSVVLPDIYRVFLLSRPGSTLTGNEFTSEETRLASAVEYLTPDGWRPVPTKLSIRQSGLRDGRPASR